MEKRSKHPGDITKWIEKVFNSCTNMSQLLTAERLLSQFNISHGYGSPYSLHLNDVSNSVRDKLIKKLLNESYTNLK